jgi:hypothetical protein
MHIFWVVIAANAGMLAAALLITSILTLIQADAEELETKQSTRWRELFRYPDLTSRLMSRQKLVEHWRTRGHTRKLFYFGVLFLAGALVALHFAAS